MAEDGRLRLPDGTSLALRPLTTADRDVLVRGFERLSPESRYRRFFSPVTRLSSRQLDYLTDVDQHDHVALIAVDEDSGNAVAVARFVRTEPGVAEPAIVVADDWQRRGVAGRMLDVLATRAREEDVEVFVAPILADNPAAIHAFEKLGDATVRREGREIELTIALAGAEARPSLRRLLQEVAAGTARPALTFWQRVTTSSTPPAERRNVIVVGVPDDPDAVRRVAELAASAASIWLADLHVVAAQRFLLDDRDELDRRTRTLTDDFEARGLPWDASVRHGDLAAGLVAEAVACGARLIVADGTEPHASAPLLGSVWDHVAHHAPCDVLIARPRPGRVA